jgi:hypothetical protein
MKSYNDRPFRRIKNRERRNERGEMREKNDEKKCVMREK